MAALLRRPRSSGIAPGYVAPAPGRRRQPTERRRAVDQALIEPLSERELEVLRLLGPTSTARTSPASSSVSLDTVRTHTQNIYAKLGVNNRRAAVRRAAELGLLSRARDRRPTPSPVARGRRGAIRAENSSPHSSHVVMRAHHIRLHGVASDSGRHRRPELQLATRTRSAMTERHASTRRPPRGRTLRDPAQGHLDARWAAWFDGLTVSHESDGTTVISGPVADQAALHGLLQRVRDRACRSSR